MTDEERAAEEARLEAEEQERIDRGDYLPEDKPDDSDDESTNDGSTNDEEETTDADGDADGDADDNSDGDTDGDADGDADDNSDADENDTPPKKDHRIPKSRLDEVITQREDLKDENELLREENEKLRKRQPDKSEPEPKPDTPDAYDFTARENDYAEALIDGDTEEAGKIRAEITAKQQEMWTEGVTASVQEDILQNQQQSDMMEVINEATEVYPFLKSGEDTNEEAVAEVMDMHEFLVTQKGMSMSDAMVKAVNMIAPNYDISEPEDNEEDETPPPKPPKEQERKKGAVERNAKVNQPPSPSDGGVGERSTPSVKNVEEMTEEEFDNIPDAELNKMLK